MLAQLGQFGLCRLFSNKDNLIERYDGQEN